MIPHRFEQCGYAPVRNDGVKDGLWKIHGARQVVYALSSLSVRDQLAAAARVRARDGGTVLELVELAVAVGGVGEVSDLPIISPAYTRADAFCAESSDGCHQKDNRKTTDFTDITAPTATAQSTGATAPISEKTVNRRQSPAQEGRPLLSQERVEAAEGAGVEFHLEEPTGFTWIYAPSVNPADPNLKLAEAAIEADRAGVEAFLRWRRRRRHE